MEDPMTNLLKLASLSHLLTCKLCDPPFISRILIGTSTTNNLVSLIIDILHLMRPLLATNTTCVLVKKIFPISQSS
jgi:hypothetical protein